MTTIVRGTEQHHCAAPTLAQVKQVNGHNQKQEISIVMQAEEALGK